MQDDKSPVVLVIYPEVKFKHFSQVMCRGRRVNPRGAYTGPIKQDSYTHSPERGMGDRYTPTTATLPSQSDSYLSQCF